MAANYTPTEPNDLYSREFLIRVPNVYPQDSPPNKGNQRSIMSSSIVGCLSMAAMVVHQLTQIGVFEWDIKMVILVVITGVVSFALTRIFETLFFGGK